MHFAQRPRALGENRKVCVKVNIPKFAKVYPRVRRVENKGRTRKDPPAA